MVAFVSCLRASMVMDVDGHDEDTTTRTRQALERACVVGEAEAEGYSLGLRARRLRTLLPLGLTLSCRGATGTVRKAVEILCTAASDQKSWTASLSRITIRGTAPSTVVRIVIIGTASEGDAKITYKY